MADDTTRDMVSMERPETGKSYFYIFNFLPYAHEFSNWNVTGVDAQYAVSYTHLSPAGKSRRISFR